MASQRKAIKGKASPGDRVVVTKNGRTYEGFLMPSSSGSTVIKLDSGYNAGITGKAMVKLVEKRKALPAAEGEVRVDPSKPTIAIIHTGGTIASKVDYRTGAAYPAFLPGELTTAVPEIKGLANYRSSLVFQMYSEDMEPEHWAILAEKVYGEIKKGADGVIVFHGTDTMAYSAAAISFMVQNLPVPVLFVGSQRSTDRGSADAAMNIICAVNFILKGNFAGVGLCMHGTTNDDYCLIIPGVNVKKMHSSRRDAFRAVDVKPYAKVFPSGAVEFLREHEKKDKSRMPVLKNAIEKKVAIVKMRPGITPQEIGFYKNYKGVVIEGTGLGNAPVTVLDKYTAHHAGLLQAMATLSKETKLFMVTQCPYGRVNMNVYSTGRALQKAGVTPLRMTSEAAYAKLIWALGNFPKEAEKIMLQNICGEIVEKIEPECFLL